MATKRGGVHLGNTPHTPTLFIRQKTHLHALRLQGQTWFCARDLGHLMGMFLDEYRTRKLAPDQRKNLLLVRYGATQETLMVSEDNAMVETVVGVNE
ncbi:hypothetical protein [Pseudomonas sp. NPDC089734]|uniref:hypothetical protein n=1 Tax=Pseudomonas sp. NPDC089734 TaxID=3364469 RepID=UPI00380C637A